MKMLRFINGLLDRLFIVIGAFLGSQTPQFMDQYVHRLAGHVEELRRLVDQLTKMAGYSNKTLEVYIQKFLLDPDVDFSRQGEFMQTMVVRWRDLSYQLEKIKESSIWSRPFELFAHFNYDIARSTVDDFQPGLSLSMEGLIYAGMGIVLGFLIYRLLTKLTLFIYTQVVYGIKNLFRRPQQDVQ